MYTAEHVVINERLFTAVEVELVRRLGCRHVPGTLALISAGELKQTVGTWWQLYHETMCVQYRCNRTVWARPWSLWEDGLDTTALAGCLRQIVHLIALSTLGEYRSIECHERAAVHTLEYLEAFYAGFPPEPIPISVDES